MDWDEKAIIQELRQNQVRDMWLLRAAMATPRNQTHNLAAATEDKIIDRLAGRGWQISRTSHKAPFDLWIEGARVEVKASTWHEGKRRYLANIKNKRADLVIFDAINGTDHWFIIPMTEIYTKTIEITSYDVDLYRGQWAGYLDAWHLLDQAVIQAPPPPPKQLQLI